MDDIPFQDHHVMPDYLFEDMPRWLLEKNHYSGAGRRKGSKGGLRSKSVDIPKVVIPVQAPSVNHLMARYHEFYNPPESELLLMDLNREEGSSVATKKIKVEKPPNAELKLAKQLLDQLEKKNLRAKAEALAAMNAVEDEEGGKSKKFEAEATIIERELDMRLAMYRRDSKTWKNILKRKKHRKGRGVGAPTAAAAETTTQPIIAADNESEHAPEVIISDAQMPSESASDTESHANLESRRGSLTSIEREGVAAEEEGGYVPEDGSGRPHDESKVNGGGAKVDNGGTDPRAPQKPRPSTRRPSLSQQNHGTLAPRPPSGEGPRGSQRGSVMALTQQSLVKRRSSTAPERRPSVVPSGRRMLVKKAADNESTLVKKHDRQRRDLPIREIERRAVQKFYLKMVAMFSRFHMLTEKLELERLRIYISGNPARMFLIMRLQLMAKARFAASKKKKRANAMQVLAMHLTMFIYRYLKKMRTHKVTILRRFLEDQMGQSNFSRVLKAFRFKVIKCQRWSRDFFACTKCRIQAIALYMEQFVRFEKSKYGVILTHRERLAIAKKYLFQRRLAFKAQYNEYKALLAGRIDAFDAVDELQALAFLQFGRQRGKLARTTFAGVPENDQDCLHGDVGMGGYHVERPRLSVTKANSRRKSEIEVDGKLIDQHSIPQVAIGKLAKSKIRERPFFVLFNDRTITAALYKMGRRILDDKEIAAMDAEAARAKLQPVEVDESAVAQLLSDVATFVQPTLEAAAAAQGGVPSAGRGIRRHTRLSSMRAGVPYLPLVRPEKKRKKEKVAKGDTMYDLPGSLCVELENTLSGHGDDEDG